MVVDLHKDSPTYGKWEGVVLSAKNKRQFFIPRGFAHGFLVLSDTAEFAANAMMSTIPMTRAASRGMILPSGSSDPRPKAMPSSIRPRSS